MPVSCFAGGVLAVVAKIDGCSFQMFHVEHCDKRWEFRCRAAGDDVWGAAVDVPGRGVAWPLPAVDRPLEVEWRFVGDGVWSAGVPMEYGAAECEFAFSGDVGLGEAGDGGVVICAAVRGEPSVWRLFPDDGVGMGGGPWSARVRGVSVVPGVGQILDAAGDFNLSDAGWRAVNLGPSKAALLPVLEAVPGVLPVPAGFYGVKAGRMSDDEVGQLMMEVGG